MKRLKITPEQQDQMRELIRKALIAQIGRWNAEGEIERLLGFEISDSEELIKDACVGIDDAATLKESLIDDIIQQYLTLERSPK